MAAVFDRLHRLPEGGALLEVEGDRDGGELPLPADQERARRLGRLGDGGERHLAAAAAAKIDGPQLPGVLLYSGLTPRMTRYWLSWVKMVDTIRWP